VSPVASYEAGLRRDKETGGDMPKFTAVMGKSKTNRIVSVEAATEELARSEIIRQLKKNPQRRKGGFSPKSRRQQ